MTALYRQPSDNRRRRRTDALPLELNIQPPKYEIPEKQHDPDYVYQFIRNELLLDGNARQNLATFCSTWEEAQIHELMDLSISKNMVDKDEYPQTAELEMRCVHMIASLWHSPEAAGTTGTSTTGSSEASMLGGLALKWNWRKRQEERNRPSNRPNIVTGAVQVCWQKFARYFDVELRQIPMEQGQYTLNPGKLIEVCDENTIGVVATLGLTFTGQYEPVEAIQVALDDLQAKTGLNIPIHVDAASGGFVAPFIDTDIIWDFRLPRVKSINASGHKYGLVPLGAGWIIWRRSEDLPEDLVFNVNYLGGQMPTFALNFSRPGGQVISQYYNFLRLGHQGYQAIMSHLRSIAAFVADDLDRIGIFHMVHRGNCDVPVITWSLKEDLQAPFTLFDFCHELRASGWQVPAYSLPKNMEHQVVARVVVRYGFNYDLASGFLSDVRRAIEYLYKHPPTKPMNAKEPQNFNHL